MKKYLFQFLAICIALGSVSFVEVKKKDEHKKKNVSVYWFRLCDGNVIIPLPYYVQPVTIPPIGNPFGCPNAGGYVCAVAYNASDCSVVGSNIVPNSYIIPYPITVVLNPYPYTCI